MTDIATLQSLLERVTSGDGADRELDARISVHVDPLPTWLVGKSMARDAGFILVRRIGAKRMVTGRQSAPAFTTDLNAAVALVERVRPGWDYDVGKRDDIGRAAIWPQSSSSWPTNYDAPTPSRALLAALLQSLIAEARK